MIDDGYIIFRSLLYVCIFGLGGKICLLGYFVWTSVEQTIAEC